MASWFEVLFGFSEEAYDKTRSRLRVEADSDGRGEVLISDANGVPYPIGTFSLLTLAELRTAGAGVLDDCAKPGVINVQHVAVASALEEHARRPGSTIQVASQFNCLEFAAPSVTPEDGVSGYAFDYTQGPDCAIAAGAGTAYRNYLVPVGNGGIGQTASHQLNALDAVERAVDNERLGLWRVANGYITRGPGLERLRVALAGRRDELLALCKIGVHEDVGVTFSSRHGWERPAAGVRVTQCYCSALSLGSYAGGVPLDAWEPLARLVLDAVYEATLWAAVIAAARGGAPEVLLTTVGAGVFGNPHEWVYAAIGRAVAELEAAGALLTVHVAHFRSVNQQARAAIDAAVAEARAARKSCS